MMKTVEKSNFPLWSQKAGAPGGRPGRYPEFSRRFSPTCRAPFSSSLAPTGPSPSRDLPRWGATMDRIRREVLTEVGLGKISNSARTDGRMRRPTTSDLDFENLPARRGPTEGCGESVSRGPLPLPSWLGASRPATGDLRLGLGKISGSTGTDGWIRGVITPTSQTL